MIKEKTMRRYVGGVFMVAPLACALMTASSYAQQKSLKEQLMGAWVIVSSSTKLPDGNPAWGTNPVGLLIFTDNGHYSSQLMRSDLPKFASDSRVKGTPEEYKAVMSGSISSFGTYTVDEANKTFTIRYEGSTFPNRKGAEDTRSFIIEGDELHITNPAPSTGGGTSQLVYRRTK
jgi:hypothetical protein